MTRFARFAVAVLLLALSAACVTTPKAAIAARHELSSTARAELQQAAVDADQIVAALVERLSDEAFAELEGKRRAALLQAGGDPDRIAAVEAAYQLGRERTADNLLNVAGNLMNVGAKVRGGAAAIQAVNEMADAEDKTRVEAVDFAALLTPPVMEAVAAIINRAAERQAAASASAMPTAVAPAPAP